MSLPLSLLGQRDCEMLGSTVTPLSRLERKRHGGYRRANKPLPLHRMAMKVLEAPLSERDAIYKVISESVEETSRTIAVGEEFEEQYMTWLRARVSMIERGGVRAEPHRVMPRAYITLAEHPTKMVRLARTKCERRGSTARQRWWSGTAWSRTWRPL